jgi:hypothetical protein
MQQQNNNKEQNNSFTVKVIKKLKHNMSEQEFPTVVTKNNMLLLLLDSTLPFKVQENIKINLQLITNNENVTVLSNIPFQKSGVSKKFDKTTTNKVIKIPVSKVAEELSQDDPTQNQPLPILSYTQPIVQKVSIMKLDIKKPDIKKFMSTFVQSKISKPRLILQKPIIINSK